MIKHVFIRSILIVLTSSLNAVNLAQSEHEIQLHGELDIKFDEKKQEPHEAVASQVLESLEIFLQNQEATPPEFSENAMSYLTGAYLVCSLKRGSCGKLLDGILQLDLLEASLKDTKKPACTRLHTFWQLWLKDEMEKKHEYHITTAFIKQREYFNKVERPKYLRCSDTVAKMLQERDQSEIIATSHAKDGPVDQLHRLLQEINKVAPNVHSSAYYSR